MHKFRISKIDPAIAKAAICVTSGLLKCPKLPTGRCAYFVDNLSPCLNKNLGAHICAAPAHGIPFSF
jgi:hypothetical protein